jgi:hypothetical protein
MVVCVHVALILRLKLILWDNLCWYSQVPSGKYKIRSWKKKEFEDLEDLFVSFRLYFIICNRWIQLMYFYHILFDSIDIYMVLIVKKVVIAGVSS